MRRLRDEREKPITMTRKTYYDYDQEHDQEHEHKHKHKHKHKMSSAAAGWRSLIFPGIVSPSRISAAGGTRRHSFVQERI
jgi:hypothetical protein